MNDIFALIDEKSTYDDAWFVLVRRSLDLDATEWLAAAMRSERISDERAWVLLGWMEMASTELVRSREKRTLELAIFARALLTRSKLDIRDIWIVVSLLRRGAQRAGLNYLDAVSVGCDAAGSLGGTVLDSLVRTSAKIPPTHEEKGEGKDFEFVRVPVQISEFVRRLNETNDGPGG